MAFFVIATVPAVFVFSQGWLPLPHAALPGTASHYGGSPEAWTLFALFYLAWMVADFVLLVLLYGRIGFHYMPRESKPREPRRKRRRRAAGLGYVAAQEQARAEAVADDARRRWRTPPPAEPDPMAGRPPRRPPAERGPQESPADGGQASGSQPGAATPPGAETPREHAAHESHDLEESA